MDVNLLKFHLFGSCTLRRQPPSRSGTNHRRHCALLLPQRRHPASPRQRQCPALPLPASVVAQKHSFKVCSTPASPAPPRRPASSPSQSHLLRASSLSRYDQPLIPTPTQRQHVLPRCPLHLLIVPSSLDSSAMDRRSAPKSCRSALNAAIGTICGGCHPSSQLTR